MSTLKVGTLVLIVSGITAGKTGEVVGHTKITIRLTGGGEELFDHIVRFPGDVPSFRYYRGATATCVMPNMSKEVAHPRAHLVPLTPPGEPEAITDQAPVRDEVDA